MARFMVNHFGWDNQVAKHMFKDMLLANHTCKHFCGDISHGKPQGNSLFFGKSGGQTGVQ